VLLVGEEEVPEPLGAGLLADPDDDLRVGDAGPDLLVERRDRLGLDRLDVLVHERADAAEQLLEAISEREVHSRRSLSEAGRGDQTGVFGPPDSRASVASPALRG
jgi:hypothetical protein